MKGGGGGGGEESLIICEFLKRGERLMEPSGT